MNFWKKLFCKHKKTEYIYTDYVSQDGVHFHAQHRWKCKECGKVL